jgi:hypothetical protein
MRFISSFKVFLEGTAVLRAPSFWERLRARMGAAVDLETPEQTISRDVIALTMHLRDVLSEASVTDATWLSIDNDVLFHDRSSNDGDLDRLIDAVNSNAGRFVEGFHVVRAVFEKQHKELEILLEATVPATYKEHEPAMTMQIAGRLSDLRAQAGESQDEARRRVRALLSDPGYLQGLWGVYEQFMASVHHGLSSTFKTQKVEEERVEVVARMPSAATLERLAEVSLSGAARAPHERPYTERDGHDPWARYYDDLGYAWADLMALDILLFEGQRAAANGWLEDRVEILDPNGALLCERAWAGEQAATLQAIHRAAQHDYSRKGARVYELRDYPR